MKFVTIDALFPHFDGRLQAIESFGMDGSGSWSTTDLTYLADKVLALLHSQLLNYIRARC